MKMNFGGCLALLVLLLTTAGIADAACSRGDIDYYLSKGFTQAQVTAICSASEQPAQQTTTEPATTPEPAAAQAPSGPNKEREEFLRSAIEGYDISVGSDTLRYTSTVCIPYGGERIKQDDAYGNEACEDVRHTIALEGMKVSRQFFNLTLLGRKKDKIYIKGDMEREVVGGLENYGSTQRRQIMQSLNGNGKSAIVVRDGESIERVIKTLRELAG